jgi:hypothetical protein
MFGIRIQTFLLLLVTLASVLSVFSICRPWQGGFTCKTEFYAEKMYVVYDGLIPSVASVDIYENCPILFQGKAFVSTSGRVLCVAHLRNLKPAPIDIAYGDSSETFMVYSPDGDIHIVAEGIPSGRSIFRGNKVVTILGPSIGTATMSADGPYKSSALGKDKLYTYLGPLATQNKPPPTPTLEK